jgi:hypothetical protein
MLLPKNRSLDVARDYLQERKRGIFGGRSDDRARIVLKIGACHPYEASTVHELEAGNRAGSIG